MTKPIPTARSQSTAGKLKKWIIRRRKWLSAPGRRRAAIERMENKFRPCEGTAIALRDGKATVNDRILKVNRRLKELTKSADKNAYTAEIGSLIQELKELIRTEAFLNQKLKTTEKKLELREDVLRRLENGWEKTK